jgi:hypothetical protein
MISAGGTASFSVTASGYPAPTYQWLQNGAILFGATNATLTITNAPAGDATTYSVVVTNSAGSMNSSNASLTVGTPVAPQIRNFTRSNDGSIQFLFSGSSGFGYRVWATTNLALGLETNTWTLLTNGTFGSGPAILTDPQGGSYRQRYYSVTVP